MPTAKKILAKSRVVIAERNPSLVVVYFSNMRPTASYIIMNLPLKNPSE